MHAITLLGDPFLRPGLTGIAVPFALRFKTAFTGLGILAAYLAMLLGLSFYVRRRSGRSCGASCTAPRSSSTCSASSTRSGPGPTRPRSGCARRCSSRARRWLFLFLRPRVGAPAPPPSTGGPSRPRSGLDEQTGVLIVGGGLAAQRCGETLRRRGYEGACAIVVRRGRAAL